MNPTTPGDDAEFARRAREIAELYAKLPAAEPDRALDAKVLAMARDAVGDQREAPPAPARTPWRAGLALAAVVVLAAGISWRLKLAQPTAGQSPQAAAQSTPAAANAAESTASSDAVGANRGRGNAPPPMAKPAAPPPPPPPAQPPPARIVRQTAPPAEPRARAIDKTRAAAPPAAAASASSSPPAAQVRAIRALIATGDETAARAAASRLAHAHPDFKLPADLRALLKPAPAASAPPRP